MNKTLKYTFFTLLFAAAYILGSMAGMDFLLRTREGQLLGANGTATIEAPVRAWQQWGGDIEGKADKSDEDGGRSLTIGQVEEVIRSREDYVEEVIHDPVKGQITIEEAIESGKKWIAGMEEGNKAETETQLHFVNAILGIRKHKNKEKEQVEPYYSFWTVQFSSQSMSAVLYMNAVTGKVWNAELTLYEDMPVKPPYGKLKCFLELSGLPVTGEATVLTDEEEKWATLDLEGSLLYARMEYHKVETDKSGIVDYADNGKFHDRYIVITYDLLVKAGP